MQPASAWEIRPQDWPASFKLPLQALHNQVSRVRIKLNEIELDEVDRGSPR